MAKICINGVNFIDFGANNYSNGMHLITTGAAITTEQVLNGEFPGVYLNPSAPWDELDCFCVLGTEEQYKEFYKTQRSVQISKELMRRGGLGLPIYAYRELKQQIEEEYTDWWKL